MEAAVAKQPGFWDVEERLKEISADGDPLETLAGAVDFERFRPILERAAGKPPGPKAGSRGRMRPLGIRLLGGQKRMPTGGQERKLIDKTRSGTSGRCRSKPTRWTSCSGSWTGRSTRPATFPDPARSWTPPWSPRPASAPVPTRRPRSGREIWPGEPAKAARKDTDARWTVKFRKAKLRPDGAEQAGIAIPVFGCKSHISIDRKHGIIRHRTVTDAAAHDGARLREGLVDAANTGSGVWADTAYRSKRNEDWLKANGMTSRIHRRKPRGRPMSRRTAKANGRKSSIRAKVEHVFAHRKDRMGPRIRTIGMARAKAAVTLANMAAT